MKKYDVSKEIEKAGLIVSLDGERVRIENPDSLTAELRSQIVRFHAAIVCKLKKSNPTLVGELIERRKEKRVQITLSEKRFSELFPSGHV